MFLKFFCFEFTLAMIQKSIYKIVEKLKINKKFIVLFCTKLKTIDFFISIQ